jgi:hypothetical protein
MKILKSSSNSQESDDEMAFLDYVAVENADAIPVEDLTWRGPDN